MQVLVKAFDDTGHAATMISNSPSKLIKLPSRGFARGVDLGFWFYEYMHV